MHIQFAPSQRSTIGIEWELALVENATGKLSNIADEVIAQVTHNDPQSYPHITTELMQNTVELVSSPHTIVREALTQLRELVAEVQHVTAPMDVSPLCSGSHPFSLWSDQVITEGPRYEKFINRTQWWGRNMMIWGVHVHVGLDSRDKVFPILHALLAYYPHLQALSASSPFWAGEATGYASNRALMFQQLPTAGLPYDLNSWEEFESYIEDLERTGIISEVNEARWDIRPSPRWGTLELRYCDGLSTLKEIGAVAALSQCLTEYFSREMDAGRELIRLQPWFVRENKWRAARYGLDAPIIIDRDGTERPVRDELVRTVEMLEDVAAELGCERELHWVIEIVEGGASYERQLRVSHEHNGDLVPVVRALTEEFEAGLDLERS